MSQQFVMRKGMTAMATKATAKKRTKKKPIPKWADPGNHKAIHFAAYANILEWLSLPDNTERTDRISLLTADINEAIEWGTITNAETVSHRPLIVAVKAKDAKGEKWNSPRLFDAAAFALIRLLTAFGGTVYKNKRLATNPEKQKGPDHHFPGITWSHLKNYTITRIAWGATTGDMEQLKPDDPSADNRDIDSIVETFYDLRFENLNITPGTKPAVRTRGDAIMAALISRYALQKKRDGLPIADDYLKALLKCFTLLDELKEVVLKQRADKAY